MTTLPADRLAAMRLPPTEFTELVEPAGGAPAAAPAAAGAPGAAHAPGGHAPLHGPLAASMERLAGVAATALRAPVAFVALLGDDRRCFAAGARVPAWVSHDPGALRRSGLLDRVALSRGPVVLNDLRTDTPPHLATAIASLELAGFVGTPVRSASGQTLGVFCAADSVPTQWTAEEVELLVGLAAASGADLDLRRTLTEREAAERKLRHDTLHDPLTGLANRAAFLQRLRAAVERAPEPVDPTPDGDQAPAPNDELVAVLFFDLNDFKIVNERLGHQAGDQLLALLGHRLEQEAGPGASAARLGGDEFAVLLERVAGPEEAEQVADRLRTALSAPAFIGGQEVSVGATAGIALSPVALEIPEHLLRSADLAMAHAKQVARGAPGAGTDAAPTSVPVVFDWKIAAGARARRRLEDELRRAVRRGEFVLRYMPTVNLATGHVSGVEALVRWDHPTRGLLGPQEFLPVAEELELISAIGRWVLREACRRVQEWNAELGPVSPLTVSVNLSARQFSRIDFIEDVARAVWDSRLDPGLLALEVNERVVARDAARAAETLAAVRHLGVRVHLDDFGTGYSSLSYLQRLPLDAVKIDHTLVNRMDRDESARRVVRTIAGLAHDIGLETVAEGIASVTHLKALRELGCTHGQGPLFSSAVDANGIAGLLRSEPRW